MRVLELSDREEAAAYCGKLFARWGAEVVRVERPDRDPPDEAPDRYLNGGKRRVALDYRASGDRDAIARLAADCDALITDAPAADVEQFELLAFGDAARPAVRTSITPFGLDGPYREWEATASTLLALGGYTFLSGDRGRAPLTLPGRYPYYQAGTFAYIASLAAHLRAVGDSAAAPDRIEVSVLETLAGLHQFTDVLWTAGGTVRSRHGNRWENLAPTGLLPCQDGWCSNNALPNFWEAFALMLGRPELIEDPRFLTNGDRMEHIDELEPLLVEALAGWPMERFFREGQETWRVPVGYAITLGGALNDPHLVARDFWRPLGGGTLRTAGSAFRFAGEYVPDEAGVEPSGKRAPPIPSASIRRAVTPAVGGSPGGPRPLEGVRVIDLTRIWSGPLATRILGDLGAEVIKVEASTGRGPARIPPGMAGVYGVQDPGRPWNRQALFNKLNRNKRSLVLDLKSDEGRDLFLRLVAVSDVVIENFSARAMTRLDLGYERLREANERVIYMPMPAFGIEGPYRDYVGLGPSIEPLIGLTALMGYSDDEPRATSQAITDAMSGTTAAAAVLTALHRRDRTGRGAFVDLSQHEAGVTFIGEYFIEQQLTGREPGRRGNAHPQMAPHGVYRCRGDDDWIAIAVAGEQHWRALCRVSGQGWADDARYATVESRREHRDALDDAIEAWTGRRDKFELMRELQAAGVAAGAVLSAPEMLADQHLAERGYYVDLDEADAGRQRYDGAPLRFGGERGYEHWTPSPPLGGDNAAVLGGLLGLPQADIDGLYERGVIADRPPE